MTIMVIAGDANATPLYEQQTTLDGSRFNLYFQFNQRCQCWYLSVADASGVDVYNGVKLVCGIPLLRKCKDPRRPAGELFVLSSTSNQAPPGLYDLIPGSGRCTLLYFTADWVALLKGIPASVVNGSAEVTFTSPQTLAAGTELVFQAQPLASYAVAQATSKSESAILGAPFTGPTTSTVAQVLPSSLIAQVQANAALSPLSTYGQA